MNTSLNRTLLNTTHVYSLTNKGPLCPIGIQPLYQKSVTHKPSLATTVGTKVNSRGGGPVPLKLPLSLAGQGKVVSNPTYSNPSAAEAGSNDGDTLRHMPNPLYTDSNMENPLYREHPPVQREEGENGIYSVPRCSLTSPTASQEDTQATGGGIYSEPDVGKIGDVSYATVGPAGGKDPAAIEGGEYARPTGEQRHLWLPTLP